MYTNNEVTGEGGGVAAAWRFGELKKIYKKNKEEGTLLGLGNTDCTG